MRWKRLLGFGAVLLLTALSVLLFFGVLPAARIGTSYYAKVLGSAVFVAGRDPEAVARQEVGFLSPISATIDREMHSVTASLFGLASSTAIYRPGYGVTLAHGSETLKSQSLPEPMVPPATYAVQPWPQGNAPGVSSPAEGVDLAALNAAMDAAFAEPDPDARRNTRAIVVIHNRKLIAERYADGFSAETPLAGWSMTKSVISALVGILVQEGKLDIHQRAAVPEWEQEGDARGALTVDQLLRMSSGLQFSEDYFNPFSDATQMLFAASDSGLFAAGKTLSAEPDSVWYYSSGTTNLLSRLVRRTVGEERYPNFVYDALFEPLGMHSALIEPDASGTLVGSSFGWATARDWARFGQLYLQDGVWNGNRILPEGWVKYSVTPTPAAPEGKYGAQWWLNVGEPGNPEARPMPEAPADVYFCSGYEGQRVFVAPSHNAVIVRLGLTQKSGVINWGALVASFLEALPPATQETTMANSMPGGS